MNREVKGKKDKAMPIAGIKIICQCDTWFRLCLQWLTVVQQVAYNKRTRFMQCNV